MQKILLTILLLVVLFPGFSQDFSVGGTVFAREGKQALPYVNIGIRGKNIGTVSDEAGNFSLSVDPGFSDDSLTFSFVGFFELTMAVKEIVSVNLKEFVLTKKVFALREVEVLSEKAEIKTYGVTKENSLLSACKDSTKTSDIAEIGQLIKIGNKNAKLLSAHIYLKEIKFDTAIIKVNLYKFSEKEPSDRLIEERIIKKLPVKDGWLSFNLEEYSIYVKEDFIMTLEFVPDKNGKTFCYGGVMGFGRMFFRNSSLGTWEKIPPIAQLSMYVTVRQ